MSSAAGSSASCSICDQNNTSRQAAQWTSGSCCFCQLQTGSCSGRRAMSSLAPNWLNRQITCRQRSKQTGKIKPLRVIIPPCLIGGQWRQTLLRAIARPVSSCNDFFHDGPQSSVVFLRRGDQVGCLMQFNMFSYHLNVSALLSPD